MLITSVALVTKVIKIPANNNVVPTIERAKIKLMITVFTQTCFIRVLRFYLSNSANAINNIHGNMGNPVGNYKAIKECLMKIFSLIQKSSIKFPHLHEPTAY